MKRVYRARANALAAGRRDRGVVLVIVILSLALVASLIFYVFNIGQQIKNRVEVQHAADAAAISGAGWVARSMNTVAMNNVQSARLIALANVLDASDEALHPAYHEAERMYFGLRAQNPGTGGSDLSGQEAALVTRQMREILRELESDYRKLLPLKRRFRAPQQPEEYSAPTGGLNVRSYTFYNGPAGRGRIWKALEGLEAYSRATMENLGQLAQLSARQIGQANLDDEHGTALMVPHVPEIPWQAGQFEAFKRPVVDGLLPEGLDNDTTNRGPFDTLFGWRRQAYRWKVLEEGNWVPGTPSEGEGPKGPGGQGPEDRRGGGHWDPPPEREKLTRGYNVYGTERWLLHDQRHTHFEHNPYFGWRNQFARWKRQYLFNDAETKQHHLPIWKTGMDDISSVAGGGKIEKARYFTMRLESPHRIESSAFWQNYAIVERGKLIDLNGDWSVPDDPCDRDTNDPRQWQKQLELWRQECDEFQDLPPERQAQWRTAEYEKIGSSAWRFQSKITRDGTEMYQYIYYFLIGVDVGEKRTIRNPHNMAGSDQLPGPIVLDRDAIPSNPEAAQREHLTYLAVAQENTTSAMWPERFDQQKPYKGPVGIAQARVFNNHSLDLWTQMWHAQLEPVQNYPGWIDRYQQNLGKASELAGLDESTAQDLNAYLRRTENLGQVMLSH